MLVGVCFFVISVGDDDDGVLVGRNNNLSL